MRVIRLVVLYTALAVSANADTARIDTAALMALRTGDMRKLDFHATPAPVPDLALLDADGGEHRLTGYRGKFVVLNFWATWCAPCRHEMPSLDRLQAEMGGARLAVVPVATGRNSLMAIEKFFAEADVRNLPVLRDPKQLLARQMAVMGLPVTVILDPEGREIARLLGDADWSGDDARAVFAALLAQ